MMYLRQVLHEEEPSETVSHPAPASSASARRRRSRQAVRRQRHRHQRGDRPEEQDEPLPHGISKISDLTFHLFFPTYCPIGNLTVTN